MQASRGPRKPLVVVSHGTRRRRRPNLEALALVLVIVLSAALVFAIVGSLVLVFLEAIR